MDASPFRTSGPQALLWEACRDARPALLSERYRGLGRFHPWPFVGLRERITDSNAEDFLPIVGPGETQPLSPGIEFAAAPLPVADVDQTRLERLSQSRSCQPPPATLLRQRCQVFPHQLLHAGLSGLLHNPSVARYPLSPAPDTTPASFSCPLQTRSAGRGPGRARPPWYRPASRARRPRAERRTPPEFPLPPSSVAAPMPGST